MIGRWGDFVEIRWRGLLLADFYTKLLADKALE